MGECIIISIPPLHGILTSLVKIAEIVYCCDFSAYIHPSIHKRNPKDGQTYNVQTPLKQRVTGATESCVLLPGGKLLICVLVR